MAKKENHILYGPWTVHVDDQDLQISIENITPERADQILEHNEQNRPQKSTLITNLVDDLKEGYFRFNGDAVRITHEDNLADAQNRLVAIAKSGVTVPMLVIRGFDPAVMDTIDQGVSRTVGDILSTHGITDPNLAIAVSIGGILLQGERGRPAESRSKTKVAAFVEKNLTEFSDVAGWAKEVSRACPLAEVKTGLHHKRRCMSPGPLGALCVWMVQQGVDERHARAFFEMIAGIRPASESEHHTYRAIQSWLVKTNPLWRDGGTQFPQMLSVYATLIVAYNRLVCGERMFLMRKVQGHFKHFDELPPVLAADEEEE